MAEGYKFHGSEADLVRAATDYLELDGWRSLKTEPVSRREWGKGFGEKGMADCLYIRYGSSPIHGAWSEVLWIEWKTPKGRIARHQHSWREREQSRGALALIAGIDFPATIEGFLKWYRASGLEKRALRVGSQRSRLWENKR